jgi:hypothetical protein
MSEEKGPYEVVAMWEGYAPEVFEEWPTKAEALHSARLNNVCRESEYVRYSVRPKRPEQSVSRAAAPGSGE